MISDNEIRVNAAKFSEIHKDDSRERSEMQTFYNDFFEIFGIKRSSVGIYEESVKLLEGQTGFIDLFWPGVLIVEQKSAGRDLDEAIVQANKYFVKLKEEEKPQYRLVSDFQNFHLTDLETREEWEFKLSELKENTLCFDFIRGKINLDTVIQSTVSIRASEMMGEIYDALKKEKYKASDMEYLLTRLTYCLFADDTGIFESRSLESYLVNNMGTNITDFGPKLIQLFQVLDTKEDERQDSIDENLKKFPYINGNLFKGTISIPIFIPKMRELLISASRFNWSKVSPAIFGSLFQSVMDSKERREAGAHYTSEENILKVIRPLFLDDLEDEFNKIKARKDNHRKKEFERFQNKLSQLKFFDPACGSGNFLIIAYREIRRLELEVILELHDKQEQRLNVDGLSKINVNQFYGIEINEFSSRIAETALWMMDHLMNNELGEKYGQVYARIPLIEHPHIVCKDALEFDWNELLPANQCDYVFGNPPFGGSNQMSDYQKEQTLRITKSSGLDYVSNWFIKTKDYLKKVENPQIAFVSTNSITQGSQVKLLFPQIFDNGFEISFAYNSFKWNSEAKGKAKVTVIIVGLSKNKGLKKRLFDHVDETIVETNPKEITAYLRGCDVRQIIVSRVKNPLNGLPVIHVGSGLYDGGNFVFNELEYLEFLKLEPEAKKWIFPYRSGEDFLHNKKRYVLSLRDIKPHELNKLPKTMQRVEKVKESRLSNKSEITQKGSETPTTFWQTNIPTKPFLAIPIISSEKRRYVPMGFMKPPTITSIQLCHIEDASVELFGLLESHMHMVWVRSVGGKLETRLRYSANTVYNTFPVPKDYSSLKPYAQKILDVRKKYPESTLADLYGKIMLPDLLKAHKSLDRAVEKLYRDEPFESDEERLEFLFEEYGKMVSSQTTLE